MISWLSSTYPSAWELHNVASMDWELPKGKDCFNIKLDTSLVPNTFLMNKNEVQITVASFL